MEQGTKLEQKQIHDRIERGENSLAGLRKIVSSIASEVSSNKQNNT